MKIAFIILVVIVVGIVGILAFAATKPDVFIVQRTASIKAPPEKVFPFINDFRQWTIWSPFEKMDPDMKRSYGAITAGKGATYHGLPSGEEEASSKNSNADRIQTRRKTRGGSYESCVGIA